MRRGAAETPPLPRSTSITPLWPRSRAGVMALVLVLAHLLPLTHQSTLVVEQTGTVLVPSPDPWMQSQKQVQVRFERPFNTTPYVVATTGFRAYDVASDGHVFAAATFDVRPEGFSLVVDRVDVKASWAGITVVASWIAWDPTMGLFDGQSGEVPLMPQSKTGFVGDVTLEFKPPFSLPPVILASVNNGPPSDFAPLSFAVTASVVTNEYAVLNLRVVGPSENWKNFVHVDWRAWDSAAERSTNYEVHRTLLGPCDPLNGCDQGKLHAVIPLTGSYPSNPTLLGLPTNLPDAPKTTDTFAATILNATATSFEINIMKIGMVKNEGSNWKQGVMLSWVAQNTSKPCLDDCMGHGVCIEGICKCDEGWTGNGTCERCMKGYWGTTCEKCPMSNYAICGGHGVCDGSGTMGGTGKCICNSLYEPATNCSTCIAGAFYDPVTGFCNICPKFNNMTCAGHGECKVYEDPQGRDLGLCHCDPHWGGAYCSTCDHGYAGDDCTLECPELCHHRGNCTLSQSSQGGLQTLSCHCDVGWDMATNCGKCSPSYYGPQCNQVCPDCGPHGQCWDGLDGDGSCHCDEGWVLGAESCDICDDGYYMAGTSCIECPGGHANPCSGHGVIEGCPNGVCFCAPGYKGSDCSHTADALGWPMILIIILASALFLFLARLAFKFYRQSHSGSRSDGKKGQRKGRHRQVDPELRKRLLEHCPELQGLEDAFSNMGSDAVDWLIDFNKLEVGPKIGRGTSSVVYRGLYFDELVAIKKLQSAKCDASLFALFFRQEAELLSKLHHPHVVRFYGVAYHEGDFYIVTEFCENTLQRLISNKRVGHEKVALEELYRIASQIANGMAYLHNRHIVHRDLKPENVLMDDRGDVKICDFGLSKLMSTDTQMTVQVGTPAFMAPEMANGSGMSESVDVYSYGVLMWALYSCENPYHNLDVTPIQLLNRVVAGLRPVIPMEMPRELAELMEWCWHPDPSSRPTFEVITREIRELLRQEHRRHTFVAFSPSCSEEDKNAAETDLISTI